MTKQIALSISIKDLTTGKEVISPVLPTMNFTLKEWKDVSQTITNEEIQVPLADFENVILVWVQATYDENNDTIKEGTLAPISARNVHGRNPHDVVPQNGFFTLTPQAGELEELYISTTSTTPVRLQIYIGTQG